jgi:hypothetical protein
MMVMLPAFTQNCGELIPVKTNCQKTNSNQWFVSDLKGLATFSFETIGRKKKTLGTFST